MDTLVVIPTYNERENLVPLLDQILALLPPLEVVVVDDNSPDGTGALADEYARRSNRVHVIHRPRKAGLGTANSAGMRFGLDRGARRFITMDADFSHDPSYLPKLVEASSEAELVIGSRYISGGGTRNWGLSRRLLSRGANWFARLILGYSIRDGTAGLRCYSREVLEHVPLHSILSNGYSYQEEMVFRIWRAGFRIREIPIVFVDRRAGRSKISRHEVWIAIVTLFRLRFGRSADSLAQCRDRSIES